MHRKTDFVSRIVRLIVLLIALSLALSACTPPPTAAVIETPAPGETVEIPSPVAPADTPTPEPELERIILVMSPPQPEVQALLQAAADESGMQLEVLPAVQPGDIQPTWKVIVLLPAPDSIQELVSAAPGAQFVVSSTAEIPTAGNLSVIRARPEHLAFAAGYIGALITPDWRIAGLLPSDGPLGGNLSDAFINGGWYYCGLCRTLYAPFVRWPLAGTLPSGSDLSAAQAAYAELEPSLVYGLYVDPAVGSVELVEWLSNKDIVLLGGETPPADVLPRWAVTIRPRAASVLEEMLPGVLAGSGGQEVNAGLELTDVNPRLFSPGRQALAEKMLADLSSGFIEPFTISGE